MDGFIFDRLTRAFSTQPTRRRLLGLLTALPLAGLVATQDDALTSASGRRRRSTLRPQRKRAGKHRRKPTRPITNPTQSGNAQGTVRPASQCPPTCPQCQTCDAATGRCVPVPNRTNCGSGNICCNGTCCSGCCNDAGRTAGTCGSCLTFVTSTTHTGNLGGLDGADQICQDRADAGQLPGSYRAWLATGVGANQSPAGRFRASTRPYVLLDEIGTQIAANFQDLITCDDNVAFLDCLGHEIDLDEVGNTRNSGAWTNAGTDGQQSSPLDCEHWTVGDDSRNGQIGVATSTDFTWTFLGSRACNDPQRLYCFQQD